MPRARQSGLNECNKRVTSSDRHGAFGIHQNSYRTIVSPCSTVYASPVHLATADGPVAHSLPYYCLLELHANRGRLPINVHWLPSNSSGASRAVATEVQLLTSEEGHPDTVEGLP